MATIANAATPAQIAAWRRQCGLPADPAAPRPTATSSRTTSQPRRGVMNKTEAAYAQHLDLLVRAGELRGWSFEEVKLRLAEGAWYTPDFLIVRRDGSAEFHEVKGHMREAAALRLKLADERFPIPFVVVRRGKGGRWDCRAVSERLRRS